MRNLFVFSAFLGLIACTKQLTAISTTKNQSVLVITPNVLQMKTGEERILNVFTDSEVVFENVPTGIQITPNKLLPGIERRLVKINVIDAAKPGIYEIKIKDSMQIITLDILSRQWIKTFRSNGPYNTLAEITTKGDNIYGIGSVGGQFTGETTSFGYNDAFFVRYKADGTRLPITQFGTSQDDKGLGIDLDKDGNIYLVGETSGTLSGHMPLGKQDGFVAKYKNDGKTLEWAKPFGSKEDDSIEAIASDGDSVYVVGYSSGDVPGYTNPTPGFKDSFLVKYDKDGAIRYVKPLITTGDDYVKSVTIDKYGNIYISGFTTGLFPSSGSTSVRAFDVFLAKYKPDGTQEWIRQFGTSSVDYVVDSAIDQNGSLYLVGWTFGNINSNKSNRMPDILLAKYSSDGKQELLRQIGQTDMQAEVARSIDVDSLGNIYVVGDSDGPFRFTEYPIRFVGRDSESYVAKYDASGSLQWVHQFGSESEGFGSFWEEGVPDFGTGVAIDQNDNVYAGGELYLGGLFVAKYKP